MLFRSKRYSAIYSWVRALGRLAPPRTIDAGDFRVDFARVRWVPVDVGGVPAADLLEKADAYEKRLAERRSQPPYRDRRVYLTVKESREETVYVVRDEGPGFDPKMKIDPTSTQNLESPRGRGLLLIRTFMDEVTFNEKSNQITMVKRRNRSRRQTS